MKRNLGILIAVGALAVACGEARETADTTVDQPQTFNEAAGDLADDVGDVSAGADQATDADKKDAADAPAEEAYPEE